MSGNSSGGKLAAQKIKASEPDFFKRIGAIGGANGRGHAFGHGLVDPSAAGRKGGAIGGKLSKPYTRKPRPGPNKAIIVKDEETEMTPAELKELFGTQEPELTHPKLFNIRRFF